MSGISALFVNDSHSNVKIEIIPTFLTAKFLELEFLRPFNEFAFTAR